MLEQILAYLRNWFCVGVYSDDYVIEGGSITLPFLQNGQYFRICGSVFNDGLYVYPCRELKDEEFFGTVWALAIPTAVIDLSTEIEEWVASQGDATPFTSESFGGYSYTKATDSDGLAVGWQSVFKRKLMRYKKL